jgi:hypothetical protein
MIRGLDLGVGTSAIAMAIRKVKRQEKSDDIEQRPPSRPEGDLPLLYPIPQPPVDDGHLLIAQVDRAPLLTPANYAGKTSGAAVAFSGQGSHLLLQVVGYRMEV